MKKIGIILIVFCLLSLSVVPKSFAANPEKQDVIIVSRSPKAAFSAVVEDGKIALNNWEIHLYDAREEEEHVYRIVTDGKEISKGSFKGFKHKIEETLPKKQISKVKVYLDGNAYVYKNIRVMEKAPTKDQLREMTKPKNIALNLQQWILQRFGLIAWGCILGLASIVIQRWFVEKRKKSKTLEGL